MAQNQFNTFLSSLSKYTNILIIIKGSPDPDAIASSYAMKAVCDKLGINTKIVASKKISLPQNKALIRKLNIPVKFEKSIADIDKFDAYIITDHQSAQVEGISGNIPCAVHIDHHEPVEEKIDKTFHYIDTTAGSTSTIVTILLRDINFGFENPVMKSVATALLYGIHTDTDKYSHASQIDYDALYFLSKFSDNDIFYQISNFPLSKRTLTLLRIAIEKYFVYKDWLITGIGFIEENNRDSIAVIADLLLISEKIPTVIVYAAIESTDKQKLTLDASFRSEQQNLNLNDIIKEITTEGGARKYKGAYQINLDYFAYSPDKDLLWKLIRITTEEVLKKRRDGIYITEFKGFYNKLKKGLQDILS